MKRTRREFNGERKRHLLKKKYSLTKSFTKLKTSNGKRMTQKAPGAAHQDPLRQAKPKSTFPSASDARFGQG